MHSRATAPLRALTRRCLVLPPQGHTHAHTSTCFLLAPKQGRTKLTAASTAHAPTANPPATAEVKRSEPCGACLQVLRCAGLQHADPSAPSGLCEWQLAAADAIARALADQPMEPSP
eukprot:227012-Prymnesium_polylepis.1